MSICLTSGLNKVYWAYIVSLKTKLNMPVLRSKSNIRKHVDVYFRKMLNIEILRAKLPSLKPLKRLKRAPYIRAPSERDWGPKSAFWALVVGKGIQYVQSSTYNLLTNIILADWGHLVCWAHFGSIKTFYWAPKGLDIGPKGPFLAQ